MVAFCEPAVVGVVGIVVDRAVAVGDALARLELVVAEEGQVDVGVVRLGAGDALHEAAAVVVEVQHLAVRVGQRLQPVPRVVAERGLAMPKADDDPSGR